MTNNSQSHFILKTSLALLAFFVLSLPLSCSADTATTNPTNNKTTITGTLTYSALDVIKGTANSVTPTWTGALTNQTVTYTIAKKDEASLPVSITINNTNGIISVGSNARFGDGGNYTVTATGTGNYKETTTADIVITVTENIQGTFTYNALDVEEGTATNATPTWTGALATQTITYTIARQNGTRPASITIDSSTGTVSLTTTAVTADSGTYTITATGSGQYSGTKQTTLTVIIRPVGTTLTAIEGSFSYNNWINIEKGTATNANPTWTGTLAGQTVTYGIARKGGASLPASITIDSSTGMVSVGTDVGFEDHGTYTITATGTGSYQGSTTANLLITITTIINTAAELQAITNNIVTLDSLVYTAAGTNFTGATGKYIAGNYQLGGDINLSGMADFTPIGSKTISFIGVFDGKGHTVTLAINRTENYVGLFGYVGIEKNHIQDTTAVDQRNNAIEIKNIAVSGTVSGDGNIGGLTGNLRGGSIIGYSEVVVTSTGRDAANNYGGLVGYQSGGTIIGYATGNVSGAVNTGGLVGSQSGGTIIGYATGKVSGNLSSIGGLVGSQTGGTITGYAIGAVTGAATEIQGFIGRKTGGTIQGGYFDANTAGKTDTAATSVSAAANIYKFAGPAEASGRTVGKFYDKATGTSATAEDSGDTEIFTVQEFIDAFDLGNTPNGRFPKLKTSLFGTLSQP